MRDESSITCVEAVSLLKLIVRVEESADPNASRELARRNRLALLSDLRLSMNRVADISKLAA